jgi:hypothetical protein
VQHILSLPWYAWLTDLGGTIGEGLALIAGVLAYRAGLRQARETRNASEAQLTAAAAKDRLQRHGIALGVAPELDFIAAGCLGFADASLRSRTGAGSKGVARVRGCESHSKAAASFREHCRRDKARYAAAPGLAGSSDLP